MYALALESYILLLACSLCLSPSILLDGSSFLFPHLLPALFSISLWVTSNPASSNTAPYQRESYNSVVLHLYCPEDRCCHLPCGQPQVQITKDTTDFRESLAIMCDLHEAWNTLQTATPERQSMRALPNEIAGKQTSAKERNDTKGTRDDSLWQGI